MHTFSTLILAASIPCVAFAPARAAEPGEYADIVAKHVTPAIESELIPGAVVGIYKDGQTSFYPIGSLNFDQDQAPTTDTLYEIGSISKVITGVFFADAIRRGEVTRDTLVNDLLPDEYSVASKDGEDVRLWHLSTHTSGWSTAPINLAPKDGERPFLGYTQTMMFEAVDAMPLKVEPGTTFEYSNLAVGLLGTLISINAESEYEQLVKDRVLAPLGIEDFTITLDKKQKARLAPATASGRNTKHWETMGPMDPAGMWITTAPGLMKFAQANINKPDTEIGESLEMAREPLFSDTPMGKICHGWMLARDGSTYWHNGMTGGYSSYMAVNPAFDAAVVVLTNGASFQTTALGEKIIQEIFGMNPAPIEIEKTERLGDEFTDRLVGTYHSELGFDMFITAARGKLFVQITGQQPLELVFLAESRFRIKVVDAEIEFELEDDIINASSVTLFQNGQEINCVRVGD